MKQVLYGFGVAALLVLIGWQWQKNSSTKIENVTVTGPKPAEKVAYVTFDDGPSEITPGIFLSISDVFADTKITGVFFVSGTVRTFFKIDNPSKSGSITSRRIKSGVFSDNLAKKSFAFPNPSTLYPLFLRANISIS